MALTTTVTGSVGPGETVTAQVLTNVVDFTFNPTTKVLTVRKSGERFTDYDISTATTFTWTLTAGLYSLTIS